MLSFSSIIKSINCSSDALNCSTAVHFTFYTAVIALLEQFYIFKSEFYFKKRKKTYISTFIFWK